MAEQGAGLSKPDPKATGADSKGLRELPELFKTAILLGMLHEEYQDMAFTQWIVEKDSVPEIGNVINKVTRLAYHKAQSAKSLPMDVDKLRRDKKVPEGGNEDASIDAMRNIICERCGGGMSTANGG